MYYIAKTWRVSCADSKNSFLKFDHKKNSPPNAYYFGLFIFFCKFSLFFASFRFLLKFQLMKENTPLSYLDIGKHFLQKISNIAI